METCINNYILRVYRLDRKDPGQLVGLVEEVGRREKIPFTNLDELWNILCRSSRSSVAAKRKRAGNDKEERRLTD